MARRVIRRWNSRNNGGIHGWSAGTGDHPPNRPRPCPATDRYGPIPGLPEQPLPTTAMLPRPLLACFFCLHFLLAEPVAEDEDAVPGSIEDSVEALLEEGVLKLDITEDE